MNDCQGCRKPIAQCECADWDDTMEEGEAILYGSDYYDLEDEITEMIVNTLKGD